MEEGTRTKKTIFVGGLGDEIDEAVIYETFSTFGDIMEVQLPSAAMNPNQPNESKHRGFAFVTYGSTGDAQDAIDNMDMNELRGRVLKVNLARTTKHLAQLPQNRAIWESEEWLKEHLKPLNQSRNRESESTQDEEKQDDGGDDNDAMEE